ncbi:MAG: tRNA (N(6)-L-threonylcarbamoyladenosine(37)-C(2))-methylthiotransferase MtaB [Nitrospirae bacterium]|nr:tRNA (N(6)-L-threonylcarbamoyladenosine(37)-C(2))-methylthiotransferase MtaB [Nitrospirota bacterium]
MKISIVTLGCKVNQSESASIEGGLREGGHEIVGVSETPDVTIINTCTVTAKSDYQSRQEIRRAVKSGARVIATGCYAQLRPDELSAIKGLDLIVGNSGKTKMLEYLKRLPESTDETERDVELPEYPLTSQPYFSARTRAFLKIQDGCNLSCTYCAVPFARGRSRSLKSEYIFNAVESLASDGYKEIVLTGIHIGSYGLELRPKSTLFEIVNKIVNVYPQIRFRLSSIEPQEFDFRFLDIIKKNRLCPHLHIPLQSGSDVVLQKMKRGYNISFFRSLIEKILSECPDVSIGTDLIIGFPGETEDDFNETIRFIEEISLSYMHVFPYSKRPNTLAKSFCGHLSTEMKKIRVTKALEIAKSKKNTYILKQLNKKLDVIVEKKAITDGYYRAISDNYLRTLVEARDLRSGQRLYVQGIALRNQELICKPFHKSL